ncbi:MAG TPA: HAMP domain-containing sensor histidine kinase [Caulobacterales bacterium]|nr:HAMP domain-containing sensor histidine kinase [Caulobacterales bacterium]
MAVKDQIRGDLRSLGLEAHMRTRLYRLVSQSIMAAVGAIWIGWWALVWLLSYQFFDLVIRPNSTTHIVEPLAHTNPRAAKWIAEVLRVLSTVVFAAGWVVPWAVGGPDADFFAAAMLTGTVIHVLVYFSNDRANYLLALGIPIAASVAVILFCRGIDRSALVILPSLLVVLLRADRARIDQLALFESVQRNREARLAAEEASRAKSQFMATVTHELRTPLNAIINYAEILEEDLSAEGQARPDDAARIRASALGLMTMIEAVIDYSRIEAGELSASPEPTDLRALLIRVVDKARARAAANTNTLALNCADDVGQALLDGRRLEQCVSELVENACRFTSNGLIVVSARHVERAEDGLRLIRISVRDTGCGLDDAALAHIFQPFHQADRSFTRRHDGFGLGLALVQRLMRVLGGDVAVESKVGEGSEFILTAPSPPCAPRRAAEPPPLARAS